MSKSNLAVTNKSLPVRDDAQSSACDRFFSHEIVGREHAVSLEIMLMLAILGKIMAMNRQTLAWNISTVSIDTGLLKPWMWLFLGET